MPLVQKSAIELANSKAKLVITATQMLESMTQNARPTRAEASDVANAIMDASDALMLSAESASGKYPLLAVRTMDRIIREVEQSERYFKLMRQLEWPMIRVTSNAVAHAAVVASRLVEAPVIVALSNSGGAARLLSEYRPEALLVGMTSSVEVYNQLAGYWGILPMMAIVTLMPIVPALVKAFPEVGGIQTLAGPVVGAAAFTWLQDTLIRATDYWRALLGAVILVLVIAFPQGIAGGLVAVAGSVSLGLLAPLWWGVWRSSESLEQHRVFTSVLSVTYRERR